MVSWPVCMAPSLRVRVQGAVASHGPGGTYKLIKSTAKQPLTGEVAATGASGSARQMNTAFSAQYQNWPVDDAFHNELLEWRDVDASDQFGAAYIRKSYGRGFGKPKGSKGRGGGKYKGKPRSGPGQSSSHYVGRGGPADGSGCLMCGGNHWA